MCDGTVVGGSTLCVGNSVCVAKWEQRRQVFSNDYSLSYWHVQEAQHQPQSLITLPPKTKNLKDTHIVSANAQHECVVVPFGGAQDHS